MSGAAGFVLTVAVIFVAAYAVLTAGLWLAETVARWWQR